MTQQSQQKWNVIQNILLLINKLWRQQHGRAVKKGYWSNWWMELGGGKKTSGSILKHFLSCRWQLPYIWGHDPPRKLDQRRWFIK